ncbi:MAG: exodeoxyribonuclease V subunit alpha [Syntrophales bacterium]|jgi:exodeoxyribonuclease V alpha subunit|nr:exodeoxyribonuclease V subunit alpha [Syntrophales bacterium]
MPFHSDFAGSQVDKERGLSPAIDVSFGRFLEKIDGGDNPLLFAAAALVSRSVREGNVCLDLTAVSQSSLQQDLGALTISLQSWPDELRKCSVVGRPGEVKPLIIDEAARLYLYRYWDYEQRIASFLIKKGLEKSPLQTSISQNEQERKILRQRLDVLFPDVNSPRCPSAGNGQKITVNWQKVAALCVLLNNLTVITGGPGTGKTATIARAIILLLEFAQGKLPRIAVAAPTGKAALRLQEAILAVAADVLGDEGQIREGLPGRAMTIHRLIGSTPHSSNFHWNSSNPLPYDIVIIDEASLIDLPLMAKLISALPVHARLILLGDREQLASVEAGAVLGDICGYRALNDFSDDFISILSSLTETASAESPSLAPPPSPLRNSLVELQRNYRFSDDSGISALSRAIKNGDGAAALCILQDIGDASCCWSRIPPPSEMPRLLQDIIINFNEYFEHIDNKSKYDVILNVFDRFRILCALRRGPYGALEVNRLCEQMILRKRGVSGQEIFYSGRPVMVTKNDYGMKLFNGDIGFILPDLEADSGLKAFFQSNDEGKLRSFSPLRLPPHETAYAMTVHKSQGSEFDNLLLILPDQDASVLTRELLYTAVTRSRKTIAISGNEDIFLKAVTRRIRRSSGLRDQLLLG